MSLFPENNKDAQHQKVKVKAEPMEVDPPPSELTSPGSHLLPFSTLGASEKNEPMSSLPDALACNQKDLFSQDISVKMASELLFKLSGLFSLDTCIYDTHHSYFFKATSLHIGSLKHFVIVDYKTSIFPSSWKMLVFTCKAMGVTLRQQTAVYMARLKQSFEVDVSFPRGDHISVGACMCSGCMLVQQLICFTEMPHRQTSLCQTPFFFCSFPCSRISSQIHTLTVFLSHTVFCAHLYTLAQGPTGSGVSANAPSSLLPRSVLSFSLLSLDSFSDMPAQAHLAAHALPLPFSSLPLHFSFAASPW